MNFNNIITVVMLISMVVVIVFSVMAIIEHGGNNMTDDKCAIGKTGEYDNIIFIESDDNASTTITHNDVIFTFGNGGTLTINMKNGNVTLSPEDMDWNSTAREMWKLMEKCFGNPYPAYANKESKEN